MLKCFDIGFYYADWGSIDAYIKLPVGTLPDALLGFSSDGLNVHEIVPRLLLVFLWLWCSGSSNKGALFAGEKV